MRLQRIKRRRTDRALASDDLVKAAARDAGLPPSWSLAKKRERLRTMSGHVLGCAKAQRRESERRALAAHAEAEAAKVSEASK